MASFIVTFYSYKGGVGRTMALANCACQLANHHGLNVVAIDWDLEAPGLHYYFGLSDRDLSDQPGLLDLLEEAPSHYDPETTEVDASLGNYTSKPLLSDRIRNGSVRIISCGRTNASYKRRVAAFDWKKYYESSHGFEIIEDLRRKLFNELNADIVLVDSRAGQSESGITPTVQLPDVVLLLFTSNRQSLEGAADVAKRLRSNLFRKQTGLKDFKLFMVPSRVFEREEKFENWMKKQALPQFEELTNRKIISREAQPSLWDWVLPVDPRYSIEEELPVLSETAQKSSRLVSGYRSLARALYDETRNAERLWQMWPREGLDEASVLPEDDSVDQIEARIDAAARRGDEFAGAIERLFLAQFKLKRRDADEAHSLLLASLTHFKAKKAEALQAAACHGLGRVAFVKGDYRGAIERYREALALFEDEPHVLGQAIVLHDLGVAHLREREFPQARDALERSIRLKKEREDTGGQALTVHQLANVAFAERNFSEARKHFLGARALAKKAEDRAGEAAALHQLGNLEEKQGNPEQALRHFEQALKVNRDIPSRRGETIVLRRLGDVFLALDRVKEAEASYRESLRLATELDDKDGRQRSLRKLGAMLVQVGRTDEAEPILDEALEMLWEEKQPYDRVRILEALTRIAVGRGDRPAAVERLRQAFEVAAVAKQRPELYEDLVALAHTQGLDEAIPASGSSSPA